MESDTVAVRGFSNTFGIDKKVEVMDLQFIEGEELERTWKAARRQRLKQQADKIWSEFVKEEDVLKTVSSEDPYQFLDQIPEEQVKELVECELTRIKKELQEKRGAGDSPRQDNTKHVVTFSEVERDDVFEIYDDNGDDSGTEENLNDTLESPCTVRERDDSSAENTERTKTTARASGVSVPPSAGPTEKNSTENVATVIESSIYCAKVKDLRIKIISEMRDMILSLENQNLASIDCTQLRKLCKRAAEYSARFQRIHLYQLQRQVNDIKRHNAMSIPFAKHTQFQSQMVRIVALHQNTLQSLQVFHKSFEHTACLRECSSQLCMICQTLRDATAACVEVPVPNDFSAAKELYNDKLLATCNDLEEGVKHYIARVDEYIGAAERIYAARGNKKSRKSMQKKRNWSQKATKDTSLTEANERLSMYSLETLRLNHKKTSKENAKGEKAGIDSGRSKRGNKDTPKSHRKSPHSRRPLMRDPHSGLERRRARAQPDDIHTMVEAVDAQSSHVSGNTSPVQTRRSAGSPHSGKKGQKKAASPRAPPASSASHATPLVPPIALRGRPQPAKNSPKQALKRVSPYIKPQIANLRSETVDTVLSTAPTIQPCLSPVSKVQCAKKDFRPNEDSEVQTMIIFDSPRRVDSYREGFDTYRSRLSNDGLKVMDSSRSETSKSSLNSRRKPLSARSDLGREAEGYEMTRLLKQLCAGDANGPRNDRLTGSKNAQLVCVNATSPRQPTTPQLLRVCVVCNPGAMILEETIQKKIPKHLYMKPKTKEEDRLRLAFNIPQKIADNLFQYRTKFVQHMLTSSMYANSTIGKPWEMVGAISEQIIDEILVQCAQEMQLQHIITEMYNCETR